MEGLRDGRLQPRAGAEAGLPLGGEQGGARGLDVREDLPELLIGVHIEELIYFTGDANVAGGEAGCVARGEWHGSSSAGGGREGERRGGAGAVGSGGGN